MKKIEGGGNCGSDETIVGIIVGENKFEDYTVVRHKLTRDRLLILPRERGLGAGLADRIKVRDYDYKEHFLYIGEVEEIEEMTGQEKIKI